MKGWVISRVPLLMTMSLLICQAAGAYGLYRYLLNIQYRNYQNQLSNEILIVQHALEHIFVKNEFDDLQTMVANLTFRGQFGTLRVLDETGKILASAKPDEVGVQLELGNPQCLPCHTDTTNPGTSIRQISFEEDNKTYLVTANPLVNQITCQGCHANAGPSLGVILTEQETTAWQAQSTDLLLVIFGGNGVLFLVLAALLWFIYFRMVDHPLSKLAFDEKPGELSARPDEIGQIARRIDQLSGSIRESNSFLEAQRRNFQAMLSLAESIDVTLTAEKVLNFAIGKVQEVTGFTHIAMRLFNDNEKCFRLVAQIGMTQQMVEDLHCIPAEIGFTGDVFRTHRAAYTSNIAADPRLESPAPVEHGIHSLISVPFLSGNRLIGSMELASKEVRLWQEEEIRWLELMGRSVGNVLHHIETSKKLQGLAVMQERAYIAQEIHDGLAQLIGALRLWAEQAQHSLRDNNLPQAQEDLAKIEAAARDAYASLREEILGLRETILPEQGMIPVIRGFLNRYQRQWGIETKLILHGDHLSDPAGVLVPPAAEIQLLRIIQEGLTNVHRHANATLVTVTIDDSPEKLLIEIRDNGQGFDPNRVAEDKFGLRIMNERAANIGGRVRLESSPGKGTRIKVELPKSTLPLETQTSS